MLDDIVGTVTIGAVIVIVAIIAGVVGSVRATHAPKDSIECGPSGFSGRVVVACTGDGCLHPEVCTGVVAKDAAK